MVWYVFMCTVYVCVGLCVRFMCQEICSFAAGHPSCWRWGSCCATKQGPRWLSRSTTRSLVTAVPTAPSQLPTAGDSSLKQSTALTSYLTRAPDRRSWMLPAASFLASSRALARPPLACVHRQRVAGKDDACVCTRWLPLAPACVQAEGTCVCLQPRVHEAPRSRASASPAAHA